MMIREAKRRRLWIRDELVFMVTLRITDFDADDSVVLRRTYTALAKAGVRSLLLGDRR